MKKILFAAAFALSLLSCRENKPQKQPAIENAVDNAESSISSIAKSGYSRGGNLVQNIYDELLKNDKALQDLDKRITDINSETNTVISEYTNIIDKSENYYHDAKNLSGSITDSATKNEIEKEIQNSADKYNLKNQAIRDLIKKTKANQSKIYDQYTIFKIRKTLPEIEKYQNAHPLKTDNLDQFIKKQNQLLEELKKLK
ncbi:hypothetical protein [Chryseobacterium bernardetii]|uniref:Lipoprotein n=1 Tax=Chryseobacterium bernardetii TaxID=1241978 RepID=A0A3G6TB28_9FLAO|nr:hypothetical protein [Chryseobacterium bernardetii]AZB26462.1 hypothetical protein EG339_18655 [Chryseobacterium bernardetii]AZB32962.1 hypothetical protein EG351_04550 [Chryseobacterium bernardetii]